LGWIVLEIKIAKNSGFCFGVKKAIEVAEEVAKNNKGKTYVHGQLVHNEKVINDLGNKGIVFVENLAEIPDGAITVLRAHGEPGSTYKTLNEKSITKDNNLTDATCPLVTLVHNVGIKLKENGYEVIIFGKADHPESIGTKFHLKGNDTIIVEEPEEYQKVLEFIKNNNSEKVAIISQTTMSVYGYKKLIENINSNLSGNKFGQIQLSLRDLSEKYGYVDTICNPTKQRQSGTEEIAKESDIVIVIGGKNSSNSKELYTKCKELGVESYFIQSAEQLQADWFNQKDKVGVTAGASTPDYLIDEVVNKIKELAA
jgi:4-hydroxy-3-methylbut-2-enyl diphosphate reductase|tara:strand:- start:80950 stop:81888 length:939 start_codon:yes stop_codon:yes gene_type:complete